MNAQQASDLQVLQSRINEAGKTGKYAGQTIRDTIARYIDDCFGTSEISINRASTTLSKLENLVTELEGKTPRKSFTVTLQENLLDNDRLVKSAILYRQDCRELETVRASLKLREETLLKAIAQREQGIAQAQRGEWRDILQAMKQAEIAASILQADNSPESRPE